MKHRLNYRGSSLFIHLNVPCNDSFCLSKADHEGNHEREQPRSFSKGKTQNGVREQLTPQAGIASDTGDQRSEDRTNTHTGTSKTDGCQTGTNLLTGFDESIGELRRVRAECLTGKRADGGGFENLLALRRLEGRLGSVVVLESSANTYNSRRRGQRAVAIEDVVE